VDVPRLITRSARSIASLAPTVTHLEALEDVRDDARRAIERGYFTPEEDDRLRAWFARYLTARAGLLETIDDLTPMAEGDVAGVDEGTQLRGFVIAYTAACLLVRAARCFIEDFATHKLVQRKLNETEPARRVPRKQYTMIYRSLTRPVNAWRLAEAMRFADDHRAAINALAGDEQMGSIVGFLNKSEESLRVGVDRYLKARLRYRWHSLRRRRASAVQQGLFRILEAFGRVIADVRNPWHTDRLTDPVRQQLSELLRPGDIIIARHDDALSNLFLPGYWPHAALHVGLPSTRQALPIVIDEARAGRWIEPRRVLEARKDGVLFRPLEDTLTVDAVTILRPELGEPDIARAISNAIAHEGKLYNFDFDFFTADRLVCTEVIYRAYEGVGGIEFPLTRRAGWLTLSAEDIVDLALRERGLKPIALFGTPNIGESLLTGEDAARALADSRSDRS
jgi:uncharacterized protein YycO